MFDQETIDRFWSLIDTSGGPDACWISMRCWSFSAAAIDGKRRLWPSHRFSYIVAHGPIPNGMVVRHLCVNASDTSHACVNPRHLRIGTRAENRWDAAVRRAFMFPPEAIIGYEDVPEWTPPPIRQKEDNHESLAERRRRAWAHQENPHRAAAEAHRRHDAHPRLAVASQMDGLNRGDDGERTTVRIVLLVSPSLLQRVVGQAQKERRSRDNMLVVVIERGLAQLIQEEDHAQSQ